MEPEQNPNRNQRFRNIRNNLKKLPIVRKNTEAITDKIEKLQKKASTPCLRHDDSETQESPVEHELESITGFEEKYQLGDKIGEGTNGVVRKCIFKSTQKVYAVKIMQIDEEERKNLKDNFIAVRSLDHPNIIKYRAMYLDYKKHVSYLVMDYETKPSLKKAELITEDSLRHIMKELMNTIEYMHSKKVCHRDIKPDNILYDKESQTIKIIDFGLSKKVLVRNQRRDMLTITGTLYYRAPEMFMGTGYDERIDLWSVGVTLYKIITGHTPFESSYVSTTIENILEGKVTFSQTTWEYYSKFVKDLILHLLIKREERLTASEAGRHFWFSQQLKKRQNFLTQSDSFNMLRSHTSKNKVENDDDFVFQRSDLTDGKSPSQTQKVKSELKNWIINNDKDSVVIEIASDEEVGTPLKK